MKIQTRDIHGFLQKPAASSGAVLLYGPDHGLIMQRGKQLAQAVLGPAHDPFSLTEISEEKLRADPPLLRDELCAMNLLASGRRVVTLRDATDKSAPIIEDAFADIGRDASYLVVLSEDLGPSASLRQLFEKNKNFAAVPCYRDDGRTLEAVIAERLRGAGVQTSSDVIRFIAAHEGADRGVTLQEIDKIILYLGTEKKLTMEIAARLAGQNDHLSQDDLCAALAEGDAARLQSAMNRSLSEGANPVMIARGLQRYFQRLLSLHNATHQGESLDDAIAKLRPPVFFKYVQPLKNHMRRWSAVDVEDALGQLLAAERDVKSGGLSPALLLAHALMAIAEMPAQKKAA